MTQKEVQELIWFENLPSKYWQVLAEKEIIRYRELWLKSAEIRKTLQEKNAN